MSSSHLTPYKGLLSPSQAAEGIALARSNAARLIADAELLLKNDRHASASALAILAIEELGKVQAIKIIILQLEDPDLKKAWKQYRSHRSKNVQWILPTLAAEGARTLMELRQAADPDSDHTAMLDIKCNFLFTLTVTTTSLAGAIRQMLYPANLQPQYSQLRKC